MLGYRGERWCRSVQRQQPLNGVCGGAQCIFAALQKVQRRVGRAEQASGGHININNINIDINININININSININNIVSVINIDINSTNIISDETHTRRGTHAKQLSRCELCMQRYSRLVTCHPSTDHLEPREVHERGLVSSASEHRCERGWAMQQGRARWMMLSAEIARCFRCRCSSYYCYYCCYYCYLLLRDAASTSCARCWHVSGTQTVKARSSPSLRSN
jgi:hypothetical protein